MKKHLYLISLLLLLFSCSNDKKKAEQMLEQAKGLYQNSEYAATKQKLDSLKSNYPSQIPVLKEGLQLMRKVELSEQERNIGYCDSMLIIKQAEADSMKKLFTFEKDPKYDEIGKYMDKQQVIEKNLRRTYVRSGVNENGEMYIASVYYGSNPIKHDKLKVSTSGGEYAETAVIPADGGVNYSFKDLGMTTEVVTYQGGKDNGVILFIYDKKELPLTAELGAGKYKFKIDDKDKRSLVKTYDFSVVLSDIEKLKKEKEKANVRITYLRSKL